MRLTETRDLFIDRLEFPTNSPEVLDAVGEIKLDAPTGDPECIAEVLDRAEETEFASADELYDTLIAHLNDQYIGRKYYDDRSSQQAIDNDEVSL
ncbi:MAG: hypothetical protein SVG88_10395 [Halobacteriales archaeon]|nr:hypothetical protein [Halobacteriales archaeon]